MNNYKLLLSFLLGLGLVGCDSRIDAVSQKMAEIRNQPPLPIEPAPVFSPVPLFNYAAHQLKSPFMPSSLAAELKIMAGKRVYPNFNRQPQPLEAYALESLNMKGSMRGKRSDTIALLQTPDGQIERVQVGSYLGMNQGRIIKISPTQIDLVEIVPDGREGYVERPRTLVLIGPAP
ncbi:pilus assembly protein PilP [Acinetobacter gyllenbergii]|uniref:Type IV pilus assembly protein PilP n=1 Tax=Acinetobacter gyllenbergii CIP 110306 = MTCC 11365 TaxID=1217657 RepID=A0A829HP55_9GAMM|nr:pilus assembly protein PilP [Acinetobacter gyllenbergii]EPF93044.1 type IV pilus assembly protein PilP [Acinetobacter gyllenbergii CIP 110306 = MTCC 11365]EPH31354.1 Type IV pilus biogenesis protein PilP [Acinetobacter gyllenbergii CIP 110306 = MTCC 11365]MCU4579665.1 pilus assembly protein PilP [Acinetobacter gyllenbergii]GMA10214.1 pilus assembly protein PilP [Acinetobacter gyllenbergii]